jgi:hypothetical protein
MIRIVSQVVVSTLLLATPLSRSLAQERLQSATVHIVYVNWDGFDLGKVKVESFKSVEGKELRDLFRENTGTKVPYGVYDMTVSSGGVYPVKRTVDVVQREVWVVVHLWFGVGDTVGYGPNFVVRGTVKNLNPNDEPIYVRLVGVYSEYAGDTKVQSNGTNGTFTLSGIVPDGRYVLITTGRSGVLDMRPLNNENAQLSPIEIDLAKAKGGSMSGERQRQ